LGGGSPRHGIAETSVGTAEAALFAGDPPLHGVGVEFALMSTCAAVVGDVNDADTPIRSLRIMAAASSFEGAGGDGGGAQKS
jgi:hypothetical protein